MLSRSRHNGQSEGWNKLLGGPEGCSICALRRGGHRPRRSVESTYLQLSFEHRSGSKSFGLVIPRHLDRRAFRLSSNTAVRRCGSYPPGSPVLVRPGHAWVSFVLGVCDSGERDSCKTIE